MTRLQYIIISILQMFKDVQLFHSRILVVIMAIKIVVKSKM